MDMFISQMVMANEKIRSITAITKRISAKAVIEQ